MAEVTPSGDIPDPETGYVTAVANSTPVTSRGRGRGRGGKSRGPEPVAESTSATETPTVTRSGRVSKKVVAVVEAPASPEIAKRGRGSRGGRTRAPSRKSGLTPVKMEVNDEEEEEETVKIKPSTKLKPGRESGAKDGLTAAQNATCSYADLFSSEDEGWSAGEDSEYEPTADDVRAGRVSSPVKKGETSGRRQTRSRKEQAAEEDYSSEEDEDDEDEDDDDDEELSDDDEDDDEGADGDDTEMALFDIEQRKDRDIYDFDSQSILSDKRLHDFRLIKQQQQQLLQQKSPGKGGRIVTSRPKQTTGGSSWGSNIYSSVATALKTRDDLDTYTAFLRCQQINGGVDDTFTDLCKPSTQHASLFYGPSAALQSLMSRINNHDRVVEVLHSIMSKNYDQLSHRIVCLIPFIHQSVLTMDYLPSLKQVATQIDNRLRLECGYYIDQDLNLMTSRLDSGRHMADVTHLVISDDMYEYLYRMVAPETSADVTAPLNFHRIVIAMDSDGAVVALLVLDSWNRAEVPRGRQRVEIRGIPGTKGVVAAPVPQKTIEEEVKEVLDDMIDWVVLKADPHAATVHKRPAAARQFDTALGKISLLDAFVLKPNGRKDTLLLVTSRKGDHKVFSLLSEHKFVFQRHGFAKTIPITLENMHTTNPEELLEDKSLLVVPDLLYRTMRKMMPRDFSQTSLQYNKFVLLDNSKRTPVSVVFDSPMRLSLQTTSAFTNSHPTVEVFNEDEVRAHETSFKPTTAEYKLVSINGLVYALQIDDQKVVRKALEIVPLRHLTKLRGDKASAIIQSAISDDRQCSSVVRIVNEESNSSTYFMGAFYPHYDSGRFTDTLAGFVDQLCDAAFDLPVEVSLYDVVFRLAQKATPEFVEAPAADGSDQVEQWGVCSLCAKELKSTTGLFDHEMRHLGVAKFKCTTHELTFIDRRAYRSHVLESHGGAISDSDQDSEDETGGRMSVFNANLLVGRMEAPQCEKCQDYFPTADVIAQHMEICDSVSFYMRTPLPRTIKGNLDDLVPSQQQDGAAGQVPRLGACVCGICGCQLSGRDKIRRHFLVTHLQCNLCASQLRSMEELSYHYKSHMESAPDGTGASVLAGNKGVRKILTCDICSNFYGPKQNYYFHQWVEHGVVHPPIIKDSEGGKSGLPRRRKLHLTKDELSYQATGLKKFNCQFCGLDIRVTGKEYVKHLSAKHGLFADMNNICRICAVIFESKDRLSEHLRVEHVPTGSYNNAGIQTIFRCDKCQFWGFAKGLIGHAIEAHGAETPAMYECQHCAQRFTDRKFWRAHLDKHSEGLSHICQFCKKAFRVRQSLLQHIRSFHVEPDDGPVSCEFCGQTYPKQSSLRHHIYRMHSDDTADMRHECSMCTRRFRLETELRRHLKEMHSGAIKCEICHKLCPNLRCYSQHRQKHFRTRIYQCTDCQTTFKSKLAMKRHIRVEHLRLDPEKFECQICGKIVTQIAMHMLIHKDARFECEFCLKKFTKSAYYNEHIRIHKGERPFECHICQKRFNKKSNLNVHLKFHEKHKDDEGNYLELKPRGRASALFMVDAQGNPLPQDPMPGISLAARSGTVDMACGPDEPGQFNVGRWLVVHDSGQGRGQAVAVGVDTADLQVWVESSGAGPRAAKRMKMEPAHIID